LRMQRVSFFVQVNNLCVKGTSNNLIFEAQDFVKL